MVNEIVNGISNAIHSEFPNVPIYSESVEQGLKEPCFFVFPLNPSESPLIDNRAVRKIPVVIQYLTKDESEVHSVAENLFPMLRRITLLDGSQVNGLNLKYEVNDGVLHFFVEYMPTVYYVKSPVDKFGDMSHKVGVDNDE